MSLDVTASSYDIIIIDAFIQTFCQPDEFHSEKFIQKLKKHLNGVVAYNLLTLCFKHNDEINLFKQIFKHDNYFISETLFDSPNKIFLGCVGKRVSIEKIISNALEWNKILNNNEWVLDRFHFINKFCYSFDYYFMFN